uniref:Uncharacterized protein n=1 Tax=Oryza punctata TaxID=4537 RepID=A0A0E0KYB2_ORYPU
MAVQRQQLRFAVRRREPELVGPAAPTPRETKRLSDLDDHETLRVQVQFVFFYRAGGQHDAAAADVVRRALGEALVPYYPLAGRVREVDGRKLVVDCTGEGVLFVEADADTRLAELEACSGGGELRPPFPSMDQLLFDVEGSGGVLDSPLLLVQVTRLLCGGFVFAVRVNHTMCDAIGISQFLLAALLRRGSLGDAVEMVREAKAAVTAEYARSAADVLVLRGRPLLALANVFVVSDHRHAGFHRLDLGWGEPAYGGGADVVFGLGYLVAVKNGGDEENAVGAVVSLPRPAMERFASEMETLYTQPN